MTKLFRNTLLIILFAFSAQTLAADVQRGKVKRLYITNNTVNFKLHGDTCKTAGYWKFKLTSEHGKAWYALLLAAAHAGKPVVSRSASCEGPTAGQYITYLYQDFAA